MDAVPEAFALKGDGVPYPPPGWPDAQITADAQIHAQISVQISAQMLRSVKMFKSVCVCVWVCVCVCVLCVCCVCVLSVCRCSHQCRCPDPCPDQCSDQCTDAQSSAQMCYCPVCWLTWQFIARLAHSCTHMFECIVNASSPSLSPSPASSP